MKYIDAEKLKEAVEEKYNSDDTIDDRWDLGYDTACEQILSIIASLQQEPRFPQYDNIVDKVFGAGNLEFWERDEAEMLVALAKEELLKSLQQKQPEVDLDAEITKENKKWTCYEEFGFGSKYDARPFDGRDIDRIAHHFYELGLNARKEETK